MHTLCPQATHPHPPPSPGGSFCICSVCSYGSFSHTLSGYTTPDRILYANTFESSLCDFCLSFFSRFNSISRFVWSNEFCYLLFRCVYYIYLVGRLTGLYIIFTLTIDRFIIFMRIILCILTELIIVNMNNQIGNKNISHQYKSFFLNPPMSKPKFEDNIQAIDKGANDFHTFLSQFKSRHQRTHVTQKNPQQNISNQHLIENNQLPRRNDFASLYQEDFFENKSEFKHRYSPIENLGQMSEASSALEIRKPNKLNSSPPAKFSQEDNIKNQHPGQLIILRSAQELPHWLFEHIRKKNVGRLKNISIEQDKQRHSQIMGLSDQFQEEGNLSKARDKMAQRYLNQSYVARKEKAEINPQNYRNDGNYKKSGQINSKSQMDYFRKASSSTEMQNYVKRSQLEGRLKAQKNQKVYINDYEYSYCPDPQAEQRKRSFKSMNHKSAVFEQLDGKKMRPAKKPKSNQYRIRHQQKHQKAPSLTKTPAKRLPTVSQQQPLVEPKKFVLC